MVPFAGYSMPLGYGDVGQGRIQDGSHPFPNSRFFFQLQVITTSAAVRDSLMLGIWSNPSAFTFFITYFYAY